MDDLPGLRFTPPPALEPQLDGRKIVDRDTLIVSLGAIGNSAGQMPPPNPTLKDIEEFVLSYVEQPLQKACMTLLANGVKTRDSSANHKNVMLGYSQITFEYVTLPEPVKQNILDIRNSLTNHGVPEIRHDMSKIEGVEIYIGELDPRTEEMLVGLYIPTNDLTKLGDIEDESLKFALAVTS